MPPSLSTKFPQTCQFLFILLQHLFALFLCQWHIDLIIDTIVHSLFDRGTFFFFKIFFFTIHMHHFLRSIFLGFPIQKKKQNPLSFFRTGIPLNIYTQKWGEKILIILRFPSSNKQILYKAPLHTHRHRHKLNLLWLVKYWLVFWSHMNDFPCL